jgi:hypothetical protein
MNAPNLTEVSTSLELSVCYCSVYNEAFEEQTILNGGARELVTNPTCDSNAESTFGITLGKLIVKTFVTSPDYTQHFTVNLVNEEKPLTIYNVDPAASIVTRDISSADNETDRISLQLMDGNTFPTCGNQVNPLRVLNIQSRSATPQSVTSQAYNFLVNGFTQQTVHKLCYCQVSLLDNELCDNNNPSHWFQIGVLHIVQMPTWPLEFILPANRDGANWPSKAVTEIPFTESSAFQSNPKNEFTITGAMYNSGHNGVQTFRCGSLADSGVSSSDSQSEISIPNFPKRGITSASTNFNQIVEWDTSFGAEPALVADEGQTLGVENFKWLCMCDLSLVKTNGSNFLPSDDCTEFNKVDISALPNFGVTVGKVYFAKTISLQPVSSDGKYYSDLRNHFTVSTKTSQYTVQGVISATSFQDLASSADKVGYVRTTQDCGSTEVMSAGDLSLTTDGVVNVNVDTTVLLNSLQGFETGQANKIKVCFCRAAVLGSCDSVLSFFEDVGFLHIVDTPILMLFPTAGEILGGIEIKFNQFVLSPQNDRFAVIPSTNTTCGNFRDASASLPNTWSDSWKSESNTTMKYELRAHYDSANSDYQYLSRQSPTQVSNTAIKTADLKFEGKADLLLCYCGFVSEGYNCGPSTFQFPSHVIEGYTEHYARFGATLRTMRSLQFLTTSANLQSFTIFRSDSDAALRIHKTSDPNTVFNVSLDRWALIDESETCGTTVLLSRVGSFQANTYDDGPLYHSNMIECQTGGNFEPCDNMYTEKLQNLLRGLSLRKYKLCLCSAIGTSASSSVCDESNALDFADHAGYVNVLDGTSNEYANQEVMINHMDDKATFSIEFGPTQPISTSDRFSLIQMEDSCGDALAVAATQIANLFNVSYTVSPGMLTVGPVNISISSARNNKYKICYCSAMYEGTCGDSAGTGNLVGYGVTVGSLFVNSFKLNNRYTISVPAKQQAVSVTFSYPELVFSNADSAAFVRSDIVCPNNNITGATPFVSLPSTGNAAVFDFQFISGSKNFYRLCVKVNSSVTDISDVGVIVSDISVTPTATQTEKTSVTLKYTYSASFGVDHFWFRLQNESCSNGMSTIASSIMTDAHAVGISGGPVSDVDFSSVTSGIYNLCLGSACDISTGSCDQYFEFTDSSTSISVFSELSVSPVTVAPSTTSQVTISSNGVLEDPSAQIWFQTVLDQNGLPTTCTIPSAATSQNTDVKTVSSSAIAFDFSLIAPSQNLVRLCGKPDASSTVVLDFYPIGVHVAQVEVSPQTVSQGVQTIQFLSNKTLFAGDYVYFLDKNTSCFNSNPTVATDKHTEAKYITSATSLYEFDFSQMSGDSRLCLLPKQTSTVIDLDGFVPGSLETRISITDISLSRTSVRKQKEEVTITYGEGELTTGIIWFQRGVCNLTSTLDDDRSTSNTVPASGNPLSFDFSNCSASLDVYNLCFQSSETNTVKTFNSLGLFVTNIELFPKAVFAAANQNILLSFTDEALKNDTVIQFRHQSVKCGGAYASPGLVSSELRISIINNSNTKPDKCKYDNGICLDEVFNFANNAATSSGYFRLCAQKKTK